VKVAEVDELAPDKEAAGCTNERKGSQYRQRLQQRDSEKWRWANGVCATGLSREDGRPGQDFARPGGG